MTASKTDGTPEPSGRNGPLRLWRLPHPALALLLFAAALLVVVPLASLVAFAIRGDAELWPHLAAYVLPQATLNTVLLLAGVAAICTVVGVGTAWLVTAYEFPGRSVFVWLLPLPLALPTYIVAYVYVDLLDAIGPVQTALRALFGWRSAADYWFPDARSLGGAIVLMSFVLYPYVYLATRAMFQTQSVALIEMARVLGAGKWRLARDITIPMARPAIAAGLALALLEALNDIGASEYLGVQTLTLSIFNTWLNRSSLPGAAQIACVMLLAVAGLIALERYGRRKQGYIGIDTRPGSVGRIPLAGAGRWLAALACLLPATLGFLVPVAYLAYEVALRGLLVGFDPALVRHTLSTILIAGSATALILALGFGAAFALRQLRGSFAEVCFLIAGLGYALPGTVVALGLLSPLVAVDEAFNWIARLLTGSGVGLVLAGSSAAVVFAYTIRFLAIATGFAQSGFSRISSEMDDAARTVGTGTARMFWNIHLPLLRPALWGAALLVFVDCLKELPATLLLRPLNVETLSTYIYQFATRGDFEEGSLAALLIVLVGIVPVIRMVRHADEAMLAGVAKMRESERDERR
ncbi:MAG: iron ABC transporter permease [Alphaproteobacteria bacterium]|nr:iron ABC transporter permease [Alphaproteobacteria bacterium]